MIISKQNASASPKLSTQMTSETESQVQYLEYSIGVPFTDGNTIKVLKNGDEIFPAMLDAIRAAKHSILFETYVYWTGDIAETFAKLLSEKAASGVEVRVLLDAHGSARMNKSHIKKMEDAGVLVNWFRTFRLRLWDYDKRTHRKILVCDNAVGFTGGVGIAKEWEGDANGPDEWRDTHFRITGPAVKSISGAFWNNWIDIKGERVPEKIFSPPQPPSGKSKVMVIRSSPATHQSEMELVFESLIMVAQKSISITTPYFNIRQSTIDLLRHKAEQNISILVLLPGDKIDKRFENHVTDECIDQLIGLPNISFHRYQTSMIHTKVVRIDEHLSCVGSPNFNQRSRKKDFEIAMLINDKEIATQLDDQLKEDLANSEPIEVDSIKAPGFVKKVIQKALMLFKEQL